MTRKKMLNKPKTQLPLIFVLFISLFPLFPLLHSGMFVADDSQSHVARLVSFYQSLTEGNVIPRWAGDLNNGFGHPVLMFLYPLSNYLGSFWHFLGFSYIDSVKLVFGTTFVLSGLFMYLFAQELFGRKVAFLTAILYLFAPYHFVDFYSRGALGEHLAFMTMPMVLWSFTRLIKSGKNNDIVIACLSLVFLILSHNAIALMFLPFFFLYLVVATWCLNRTLYTVCRILASFVLGFGLSAFFWIPAFFEGKYTLRDVLTNKEYTQRFPDFLEFFYTPLNIRTAGYLTKEVGWAQWLAVLSGLLFLIKSKKRELLFFVVLLTELTFWLAFFLLNKISLPVWHIFTILQKFQFPWRFLSLSVLTSSLLGVSFLLLFKKKSYQIIFIMIIIFITVISTIAFWQPRGYLKENDHYFIYDYKGTTDTGESSPIWSIRGMESEPKQPLEIIDGQAKTRQIFRNTTNHWYQVEDSTRTRFVDNTVYFPGWEVLIDGVKTNIEFQDENYRGLITFYVPKGKHQITVKFGETKLRTFADLLSLGALLTLIGILLVKIFLSFPRMRESI